MLLEREDGHAADVQKCIGPLSFPLLARDGADTAMAEV
jgi:hypothetical protein